MARHTFGPTGGRVAVKSDDELRHDTSCFADEVVIDFPSPARAIDRIRHAFVADERIAPVPAILSLSPREARQGATVPLDVSVRCTCRVCGGRGETWAEPCGRCAGGGVELLRHQVQVSIPAGVAHGDRFHFSVSPRHDVSTRIELRVLVA